MTVNLEPARRAVEGLMDDWVTITRDPEGTSDDTFDQTTGGYTPVDPDSSTVYDGKALISSRANVGREGNRGGGTYQVVDYTLTLPLDSDPVRPGDTVTVISSLRQPQMVAKSFRVTGPAYGTLAFAQRATMEAEEAV